MDARAFRLSWPAGTRLYEVDRPEVLALKRRCWSCRSCARLLEFVETLGAPWRFGTDEPEALLEPPGWTVTAHDLGTFAAEAGRWSWPVVPRSVPGVPRSFLVEATRR